MRNKAFARQHRRRGRRVAAIVAAAGAMGSVLATTSTIPPVGAAPAEAAASPSGTRVYTLPGDEVFPDGIAVDGDTYYATGENGTVYRGVLDEPEAEVFITDVGVRLFDIEVVPGGLLVARGSAGV